MSKLIPPTCATREMVPGKSHKQLYARRLWIERWLAIWTCLKELNLDMSIFENLRGENSISIKSKFFNLGRRGFNSLGEGW
jgi:hypothetical protein